MKTAAAPTNRAVRRIRARAILFLMLALAAGAGAVFLAKTYMDRVRGGKLAAQVTTEAVVIAATDVAIGTPFIKEHLILAQWPKSSLPAGTFSSVPAVVGRTPTASLLKGEPVLAARLADEKSGRGLTALLSRGTRAMAVKVDQVIGVAGFVQPGDYVDVITTMSTDEETKKELGDKSAKVAKIILQNIRVLTVGEHMSTQGTKPVKVQVVNLEVTPEQSERLALASRHGEIQLTMRSRIDQQQVPSSGITPVALLAPEGKQKKKEEAPRVEQSDKQWLAKRTARKRPQPGAASKDVRPATKSEVPVVEVLRGDRVEERKLRPSADTR